MRKKLALMMALFAVMLMIAGCGRGGGSDDDSKKYTLTTEIAEDGKSVSIFAYDADEGDFTMSGGLNVGGGEKVVCRPAMNEGYITIELVNSDSLGLDEDASGEDIQNVGDSKAEYTLKAEGTKTAEVTPEPGDYYVRVTTGKDADGAVTLSVEPAE